MARCSDRSEIGGSPGLRPESDAGCQCPYTRMEVLRIARSSNPTEPMEVPPTSTWPMDISASKVLMSIARLSVPAAFASL